MEGPGTSCFFFYRKRRPTEHIQPGPDTGNRVMFRFIPYILKNHSDDCKERRNSTSVIVYTSLVHLCKLIHIRLLFP
jgi:hypothetical protein